MTISVNGRSYLHLIYVFFANFLSSENIYSENIVPHYFV